MHRLLLIVFLLLWNTAGASAQQGPGARVADEFARPAIGQLVDAAAETEEAIAGLCAAPGAEALAAARDAFARLVNGWGRVTVLRFGPLAAESRFERLFFWPDPRGIALRQVQQLLAAQEEDATSVAGLSEKSAALQGIPALEFALHGSGAEELVTPAGAYRCRYAEAVAGNIAAIASETLAGWQADALFARAFTAPGPDADLYRTGAEVDGEIVKALSTLFQYIRGAEIVPPLGEDASEGNGRRAPLWRSGLTFDLIAAQLDGARGLIAAAGYAESLPEDQRFVIDSILFELYNTIRILGEIEAEPEAAFRDEAARGKIAFANIALDHAGHLVSEQLAAALGLIMGFNALDGD